LIVSKGVPIPDTDAEIVYHADRTQAAAVYSANDVTENTAPEPQPGVPNAGTRLQTTFTNAKGIVEPISLELYMNKSKGVITVILVTYGRFTVAIPGLLSLYGPDYTKQLAADFSKQGFVIDRKTLFEFGGEKLLQDLYWDRKERPDFGGVETYFILSGMDSNKAITYLKVGDQKTVSRKAQLLIFSNDNKPVLTLDADVIAPSRD
jgi:hypothetical protein